MIDLGVVVVGTARKHDAVDVVGLHPLKGLVALAVHGFLELEVGLPGDVHSAVNLGTGDVLATEAATAVGCVLLALDRDELVEAALELLLVVIRDERVEELDLGRGELVDVQAERLRVAHDDRAVVVIARRLVLLALPTDAGHPDEVRVLLEQVHDVTVAKLRRIADGLGRHRLDARLVGLLVRLIRQHDRETQLREERVPEGVVLVHVEGAGDTHGAMRCGLGVKYRTIEQQLVLEGEEVGGERLGTLATRTLLAAIARDELTAVAEVVDREQAVVGAAAAVGLGLLHLEVVDLLAAEQGRGTVLAGTIAGEQGGAIAAHAAGDVRANRLAPGKLLERAQRRVTHEGAALDDDIFADLLRVAHLDDLEQRVLDDRVGEAGRDVANGRALLLGLLHARVHEDGAAAAKVNGLLGTHGGVREVLDGEAHRIREALDEAAAARGARLVEHDVLDDAVVHAQALHVLTADVEDELDVGDEGLGAAKVSDSLDLA